MAKKNDVKDAVKKFFLLKGKVSRCCAAFAALLFLLMLIYPDAWHFVRYYSYEGWHRVLAFCNLDPEYDNLSLGTPYSMEKIDRVLDREGYALGYSEKHEQPLWVTYRLTAAEVQGKKIKRTEDFREDPRILTRSAQLEDYKGSGYDRGHLAPAADMGWSKDAMSESFYMSNMSPQAPDCNRGIWLQLEKKVREFAVAEKEIFVVSGPIFEKGKKIRTIGKNKVSIPHAYYKVVYDLTAPEKMIAFIIPNAGGKKKLQRYAVSVKDVEDKTGLTFFPALVGNDLEKLKKSYSVSAWHSLPE